MNNQPHPILCTEQPLNEFSVFINQKKDSEENLEEPGSANRQISSKIDEQQIILNQKPTIQDVQKQHNNSTSLIRLFHLRHFINKLVHRRKQINQLTKYHFDVINDRASSFNLAILRKNAIKLQPIISTFQTISVLKNQKKSMIISKTKQLFHDHISWWQSLIYSIPLIDPESKLKVFWDCLMAIARMYFILVIPIDLAWDSHQFIYDVLVIPTTISLVLLIIDFFFSLFQSYYQKGQLVKERKQILMHVMGKAYGLEIASIIVILVFLILTNCYGLVFNLIDDVSYLLLLLTFVQYNNIALLRQQLEDALNLSKEASSIVQLSKLFFLVFYVIHLFACIWFWVGNYSNRSLGNSWLEAKGLLDKTFGDQYLFSFYYSTVTMFTVGYGDITPQSNPELIVSIIFMMVCSVQLSYSVSTVGAIIDKISASKEEKQRKFHIINSYMDCKNISYELKFQVREYLNYYWDGETLEETEQENMIIDQLSSRLREKVIFEAHSRILNSSSLFKDNFSEQFKIDLVNKIKSVCIAPENVLDFSVYTDDVDNSTAVCFIEQGSIKVMIENENSQNLLSSISLLDQGESFGFVSFISGIPSIEKYKTLGFTKLLVLTRKAFLEVIKEYPEDYELFCQFQDDLKTNNISKYFPLKCFSCSSRQHRAIQCPLLHYVPDREKIIKSAQFNLIQNRKQFDRNNHRLFYKFKATIEQKNIEEFIIQEQNDNIPYTLLYDEFQEEYQTSEQQTSKNIICQQQQQQQQQFQQQQSFLQINSNSDNNQKAIIRQMKQQQPAKQYKNKNSLPYPQEEEINPVSAKKPNENKKNLFFKFQQIVNQLKDDQFRIDENQFIEDSNQQLQYIQFRLQSVQPHLQNILDAKLVEDLNFMEKQLRILVYDEVEQGFDLIKSYKKFQTHNNIESILGQQLQQRGLLMDQIDQIQKTRTKLLKYMFYPQVYIEKYKQIVNKISSEGNKKLKKLKRVTGLSIALMNQRTLQRRR